ncbi:DUF1203 domain-containing protein [Undibacterium sp. Ren11W]|uniref:DUF1203 domain-containing protein n=1 Tax=Undibacterium sp. Ren11W TaxID=3413045 RepID=UPI003BF212CA
MTFQIRGLAPEQFTHLFSLSDAELRAQGIDRHIANAALSFPCRVSLQDAAIGEELLLLNFAHLDTTSAYQAKGPIFVRRHALLAPLFVDTLPPMLDQAHRLFSVRAFDSADRMVDAEVASGGELQTLLESFLRKPEVNYLHVHFARRGCFAARVDRHN